MFRWGGAIFLCFMFCAMAAKPPMIQENPPEEPIPVKRSNPDPDGSMGEFNQENVVNSSPSQEELPKEPDNTVEPSNSPQEEPPKEPDNTVEPSNSPQEELPKEPDNTVEPSNSPQEELPKEPDNTVEPSNSPQEELPKELDNTVEPSNSPQEELPKEPDNTMEQYRLYYRIFNDFVNNPNIIRRISDLVLRDLLRRLYLKKIILKRKKPQKQRELNDKY